tara:strand:- start:5467 stop:6957 length:1491 start_codon:yes stop_codon:yes gene_type:complete
MGDNVEPDVIFGQDPNNPDAGTEPEPSFPGSTPGEGRRMIEAPKDSPRFGLNKAELLLAVDLCTLAYDTTVDAVMARAQSLGIPIENPRIISMNGSEALVCILFNTAVVAFRGTEVGTDLYAMASDVGTDLEARSVNLNIGIGLPEEADAEMQGICHLGFTKYVGQIYGEVEDFLLQNKDRAYILCGHSLGAAAAVLFAYGHFVATGRTPQRVYAVGAPKGLETFGNAYEANIPTVTIMTRQDLITYVDPLFYSHKGYKVLLEADGSAYTILTPNEQPDHIPSDPEAQFEFMRLRQQSNKMATHDEQQRYAQSDAATYESRLANAAAMASKLMESITARAMGRTATTGKVTGHLLTTYRNAVTNAIPDDFVDVPAISDLQPKPWFDLFNKAVYSKNLTYDEFLFKAQDKYNRNKQNAKDSHPHKIEHPKDGENVQTDSKSHTTVAPTVAKSSAGGAPLPAHASKMLQQLTGNVPIMGYVFYDASQKNEIEYNLVAY